MVRLVPNRLLDASAPHGERGKRRSMSKVRVAMVGSGGFARYHMRNFLEVPEAEIVGLADTSEAALETARTQIPQLADVPVDTDYRKLLDRVQADAAVVATPHTLHADQAVECFDRGLNVLVDKPMVTTVADAHRLIAKRDQTGKVGMVSYQRHTQGEFRYIKQKVESGEYGKVQLVQATLGQEWKRGTQGSWRQDPALSGGGQLNDSGSHMLDVLLWMTGLKAQTVAAHCDDRGTPVDINTTMSVQFEGGAQGSICIAGDAPNWHEDITVWCDRAAFYVRFGKLTIVQEDGTRLSCESLPGLGTPERNFVAAIRGDEEVAAPFECGLRVIELTQAAWDSAAKGGELVRVASA